MRKRSIFFRIKHHKIHQQSLYTLGLRENSLIFFYEYHEEI